MEIGVTLIRDIAEYVGGKVFEEDTSQAEEAYENIHKIPIFPEKRRKPGTLYILTDGSAVNTRIEDENGSTRRENKLVMAFTDRDMLKRANGDHIITKKEYMLLV